MGAQFSNQQRVITTMSQLEEEIDLFRHDQLISSFLDIAVGQTVETARRFLQTTDWNINEAINLYLTNNNSDSSMYQNNQAHDSTTSETTDGSNSEESDSRLSSSFSPPSYRLQEGSFEDAKSVSIENNLWLIVNLQSKTELASHMLNRDVWGNDAVSRIVESNFILWQVYNNTTLGQKISSFYKIESAPPVVLVIDPITGLKMDMWSGMIEAESFVEGLMKFTDVGPHEHIASPARNMSTENCLSRNTTYQTPAPSWGEEFEEEDTWSSRNNTYQNPVPSWGEEFEEEDTWLSRNSTNQVVAPSWGEEFAEEDTWTSNNNNNQVVAPSWAEEFEDQDRLETWSSKSDSDDFVPPFIGDEYVDSDEIKEDKPSIEFPVLTDEPKEDCDTSLVCSICVRFPDGRKKQRKFLNSEPGQLLWSFCYSHMDESDVLKAFKLVHAIPGASKILDYGADTTFYQSGLSNSLISVTWE